MEENIRVSKHGVSQTSRSEERKSAKRKAQCVDQQGERLEGRKREAKETLPCDTYHAGKKNE